MTKLEAIASKILGTMRYCYLPLPSEVNEEEWRGDAEAGGAKDYVVSLFYDEIKKAYIQGYVTGFVDPLSEPNELMTLDSLRGAEKSFLEWYKS